jgi:hypothetical protein
MDVHAVEWAHMRKKHSGRELVALLACALAILAVGQAHAQTASRIGVSFEAASVWSARNDVRIPPDTGTEFSIVDLIGSGPAGAVRTEVTIQLAARHGLRFVHAPLRVTGRGTPSTPISFAGRQFAPVPTDAEYQFSSYRAIYRYRLYDGATWRWHVGFTGFVRDARIALIQPGTTAEDTDVGFVPLGHVGAEARLADRWSMVMELDGAAAPQGRAFDFSAILNYQPTPRWTVGAGYRTIEGGADVEQVFTFAWLNAAIVRVGVRF